MEHDEIIDLAERQWSLVATWQLRAFGFTAKQIGRLRRGPDWVAVTRRVLMRSGVRMTEHHRFMAAALDAGPDAFVSYGAGVRVWLGERWHHDGAIDVSRPRGRSRRPSSLAVVHEVRDLHPRHVKVVDGIPVASPARLVVEVAAVWHPGRTERLLDTLWAGGLLDGATLLRVVEDVAGRGRAGSALVRELAAVRGEDYVPTATGLERRFEDVLRRAGLPPMRRQVHCGNDREWSGRVDFRDEELPLVVEVQSERFHASLVDRAADAARKATLRDGGWEVEEVWDTQVWHEPAAVVAAVQAGRRAARARLSRR